jgi:hypothetical protein
MTNYFKKFLYLIVFISYSATYAGSHTAFFRAVAVDDAGTVSALLAQGLDPNLADESGQVALFLALREASPKVLTTLLSQPGIRVDATNANDETPLMMAALRGESVWAQRLLERGAQVNRPGWAPLHYAACSPDPEVVVLLLEHGAVVEAMSPNHTTPLMMAAGYGTEAAVDLLRARGASVRTRNDKGLNAIDFARQGGRDWLAAKLEAQAR